MPSLLALGAPFLALAAELLALGAELLFALVLLPAGLPAPVAPTFLSHGALSTLSTRLSAAAVLLPSEATSAALLPGLAVPAAAMPSGVGPAAPARLSAAALPVALTRLVSPRLPRLSRLTELLASRLPLAGAAALVPTFAAELALLVVTGGPFSLSLFSLLAAPLLSTASMRAAVSNPSLLPRLLLAALPEARLFAAPAGLPVVTGALTVLLGLFSGPLSAALLLVTLLTALAPPALFVTPELAAEEPLCFVSAAPLLALPAVLFAPALLVVLVVSVVHGYVGTAVSRCAPFDRRAQQYGPREFA